MPSYATPIPLTVDDTLFADKAAANHFFTHFELPEASTTEAGVVLKATSGIPFSTPIVLEEYALVYPGTYCPTQAAYESMNAKLTLLQDRFDDLVTRLQTAGVSA